MRKVFATAGLKLSSIAYNTGIIGDCVVVSKVIGTMGIITSATGFVELPVTFQAGG